MKRKAFELALITAVIITLLASPAPSALAGWWFGVFPNAYSVPSEQEWRAPEIRFRLLELLQSLRYGTPPAPDRSEGVLRELIDLFSAYHTDLR